MRSFDRAVLTGQNRNTREITSCTTNPAWNRPWSNLGCGGERATTNGFAGRLGPNDVQSVRTAQ